MYFLIGLLLFSLIEYVHHRWGGHTRTFGTRLYRSHQNHHIDPPEGGVTYPEKLGQRLPLVVGLSVAILAGLLPLFGIFRGGVIISGVLAGYLYSEWFHHKMHHRLPRNRLERWLWRLHYTHHFRTTKKNYGFTSPLWDWVFMTYTNPSEVRIPSTRVPEGLREVEGFSGSKST